MATRPKEEHHANQDGVTRAPLHLSLGEIRQLVALMHSSDVQEISIARPATGSRLVLRKTIEVIATPTGMTPANGTITVPVSAALPGAGGDPAPTPSVPPREYVTAPLVGTFHPAMRSNQPPLAHIGDVVRACQVVGAVETLNVMSEVEAQVAGRVVEILATPGQFVEYGQPLIALEPIAAP